VQQQQVIPLHLLSLVLLLLLLHLCVLSIAVCLTTSLSLSLSPVLFCPFSLSVSLSEDGGSTRVSTGRSR